MSDEAGVPDLGSDYRAEDDVAAAMVPYARALRAYYAGDTAAELKMRRDDGVEHSLPPALFFRTEAELPPLERQALELCRGRVLDVGAGTGVHSLILQERGVEVLAIDISPIAVEIMSRRGVRRAVCADVYAFQAGEFDTMLLLGHGLGLTGDPAGLDQFLAHARSLLRPGGCVLLDSLDVARSSDPVNTRYNEAQLAAGHELGQTRIQFGYAGEWGPFCGWFHVRPDSLRVHAQAAGLDCAILQQEEQGDYLARLELPRGERHG